MRITDDQLRNLPDESEAAFAELEQLARRDYFDELRDVKGAIPQHRLYQSQRTYLNYVQAAAQEFEIDGLPDNSPPNDPNELANFFRNYLVLVDRRVFRVRLRAARRFRQYSVQLSDAAKQKIGHLLQQIKDQLSKLTVNERKKEILLKKVLDFELELGRERTRFEIFAGIVVASASLAGEAAKKAEPIRKWIESISNIVGAAKAEEDNLLQLPGPLETKRIEHRPEETQTEITGEEPVTSDKQDRPPLTAE